MVGEGNGTLALFVAFTENDARKIEEKRDLRPDDLFWGRDFHGRKYIPFAVSKKDAIFKFVFAKSKQCASFTVEETWSVLKINFSSEQVSIALQNWIIWHNSASQHPGYRWYGIVDLKDVSLEWFQCTTNDYTISQMLSTPCNYNNWHNGKRRRTSGDDPKAADPS